MRGNEGSVMDVGQLMMYNGRLRVVGRLRLEKGKGPHARVGLEPCRAEAVMSAVSAGGEQRYIFTVDIEEQVNWWSRGNSGILLGGVNTKRFATWGLKVNGSLVRLIGTSRVLLLEGFPASRGKGTNGKSFSELGNGIDGGGEILR